MIILKRYALREMIGPTLLGLLFFTFLLFTTKMFRLADILMSEGVSAALVGRFALCLLPALLSFTIPCAVLVGMLISFGRLAADNEILAMRTGGIHLMTIFLPVIVLGAVISGVMFAMNYALIPNLNFKSMDYIYRIEFQLINTLRPGRFYDDLGTGDTDVTFYYGARDTATGDLLNIHMKVISKIQKWTGEKKQAKKSSKAAKQETLLLAERGRIIADTKSRTIRLHLYNGSFHPLVEHNPSQNNILFFKELIRIFNPTMRRIEKGVYKKKHKEMTIPELLANIQKYRGWDVGEVNETRVALLQRFSNPLACLAFILIGMPLAIYIKPSGKSVGFAVSFGLLFLYYVLMKWGASLGEVGHPLATLAIFSPNILLGVIGSVLIYLQTNK